MPQLEKVIYEAVAQGCAGDISGIKLAKQLGTTARRIYRIRDLPEVKERIAEISGIALEKLGISPEVIIMGVSDIAFDETAKDADRLTAYKMLGKDIGMFQDRLKLEGGESPIKCDISPSIRGVLDVVYKQA